MSYTTEQLELIKRGLTEELNVLKSKVAFDTDRASVVFFNNEYYHTLTDLFDLENSISLITDELTEDVAINKVRYLYNLLETIDLLKYDYIDTEPPIDEGDIIQPPIEGEDEAPSLNNDKPIQDIEEEPVIIPTIPEENPDIEILNPIPTQPPTNPEPEFPNEDDGMIDFEHESGK